MIVRCFVPVLRLAALLPPQDDFADKFGGLPWGFPSDRWPRCRGCGEPQSLLAQLRHSSKRLDLGREGRVLHVFQCADWWNNGCFPSEPDSGANASIVLEPEEVVSGFTPPPGLIGRANDEYSCHGHIAARVVGWTEHVEQLPADEVEAYFDPPRHFQIREGTAESISLWIKVGGIPRWANQGPLAPLQLPPWRFAVQLNDGFVFTGPPVTSELIDPESGERIVPEPPQEPGGDWYVKWTNFGDGIGYVYLNNADPRDGRFTWQRL